MAARALPRMVYDYYASGAHDEITLGAQGVLIGRPVLWGLAAGGEEGVLRVLEMLRAELDLAMALCGARTVSEVTRDLIL